MSLALPPSHWRVPVLTAIRHARAHSSLLIFRPGPDTDALQQLEIRQQKARDAVRVMQELGLDPRDALAECARVLGLSQNYPLPPNWTRVHFCLYIAAFSKAGRAMAEARITMSRLSRIGEKK